MTWLCQRLTQFVFLFDDVRSPFPARFLFRFDEAGRRVQMCRCLQRLLRPKDDLGVPLLLGESDRLGKKLLAKAVATNGWGHQEPAKLSDFHRGGDDSDAPDEFAILFGDPKAISGG